MNNIKKIGIDIDDTIYPFMEYLLPILNKDFWKQVKIEEIKSFDLLHLWNINKEQFKNKIKEYNIYEIWEIYNEIFDFIQNIQSKNIEIIFITSRFQYKDYDTINKTKKWLKTQNLYDIDIIFTHSKWNICKTHNIDIFIDDWVHNILDILNRSTTKVFLRKQPWNWIEEFNKLKIKHLFNKINRLNNLNEIFNYIK